MSFDAERFQKLKIMRRLHSQVYLIRLAVCSLVDVYLILRRLPRLGKV